MCTERMGARSSAPKVAAAASRFARNLIAAALLAWPALTATPAAAQQPPFLELIEVLPDQARGRWISVSDGHITQQETNYSGDHAWTSPPARIDGSGFDITMTTTLQLSIAGEFTSGTAFSTTAFEWEGDRGVYYTINGPKTETRSATVHLTPSSSLGDGQIVDIWVGGSYGPGVYYKYRVSNQAPPPDVVVQPPPPPPADPQGQLEATLDCPSMIVISALPSLNCHILVTSFRRNTADFVQVILPAAVDTFGNHTNGIQVVGAGQQDVYNWDQAYSWGLFVFACPGQQGAGVNCYGNVTAPTSQTVPIIVQQGSDIVRLTLAITATSSGGAGKNLLAGQTLRLGNVWRISQFINLEENGAVTSRSVPAAWESAQWELQEVAGTEYIRFRNIWKPDVYLHMQNGGVEAGPVDPSSDAAHWAVEWITGTNLFRIRNSYNSQYLNTETGPLSASAIQDDWLSARWWVLP